MPSVIDGVNALTRNLYIGGWTQTLNPSHGDASNHSGELVVKSGNLRIADFPDPGNMTNPDCYYLRLGFGGAVGTLNQSGGNIWSCTFLSIAFEHPDSLGIWNVSAGVANSYGVDLGSMGTGIINMNGGSIVGQNDSTYTHGDHIVGRGYFHPNAGYETGVGLVNMRAGVFYNEDVTIAEGLGSTGTLAVRRTGITGAAKDLIVGKHGSGSLVQSGGWVIAKNVVIGSEKRGYGLYTISGGNFIQYNPAATMTVGSAQGGIGHFMIVGPNPVVSVRRYFQNERSRLTVMLEGDAPHISPLLIDDGAEFVSGAILDVELPPEAQFGFGVSYTPDPEQVFNIISVLSGSVTGSLALDPDDANDWQIETIGNDIFVRYCEGFAGTAACDGL